MEKEIVFKTEVIQIDDLDQRERQIYDAGYQSGLDDAKEQQSEVHSNWISALVVIGVIGIVIFIIHKFSP
jgi:hypothetical protein